MATNSGKGCAAMIGVVFILCALPWPIVYAMRWHNFKTGCIDYLARAADAPTVELAIGALDQVIIYADEHGLTHGHSGLVFETPSNDVGYWYNQLLEARAELVQVKSDSSMAQSNALMKMREMLTEDTKSGTTITMPDNLSIYPNVWKWLLWMGVSGIFGVSGCLLVFGWFNGNS